jgi:REP element-mobilizing transposase RayT
MVRPLRIEYPGAWYHVMNRGRRGEQIFLEEADYKTFLELLMESVELWNLRIAAYCQMENHYHLLVQTPDANLSRCMRHINGVYTQRFNRLHRCDGQLFRGRYKAILVDADSYLLQLVRYIHRNPFRAGIVEDLSSYEWSSHRGYLSKSKRWGWLHKDFVLSILSEDKRQRRRLYREFVAQEDSAQICQVFEKKKLPTILGSEGFIDRIRSQFFESKKHIEVPESRILAPERKEIKELVCRIYGVREEDLVKPKRGSFNEPRSVAIYLTRQLRGENLAEICKEYGLKTHSSASSAVKRVKGQMIKDRRFGELVDKLTQKLSKRQTET